jgi:hypothetical protein
MFKFVEPLTLHVTVSPCLSYAVIALLHLWWASVSRDAETARGHIVDAVLHALLAIVHIRG